jgi:hypothetical protein
MMIPHWNIQMFCFPLRAEVFGQSAFKGLIGLHTDMVGAFEASFAS